MLATAEMLQLDESVLSFFRWISVATRAVWINNLESPEPYQRDGIVWYHFADPYAITRKSLLFLYPYQRRIVAGSGCVRSRAKAEQEIRHPRNVINYSSTFIRWKLGPVPAGTSKPAELSGIIQMNDGGNKGNLDRVREVLAGIEEVLSVNEEVVVANLLVLAEASKDSSQLMNQITLRPDETSELRRYQTIYANSRRPSVAICLHALILDEYSESYPNGLS
ncbi:hypothetical protein C8R42DRAFT_637615 [Lentinula raphanica]|nr:hypothetical protein C8R42DRAFT_637615 [Lentinula raphanica]